MITILKKLLLAGVILTFMLSLFACKPTPKIPEGYVAEQDNGMMFDYPDFKKYYNYAPTLIVEGDKAYLWYCTNIISAVAGDHVAYREGVRIKNKWYWSEQEIVLYPGNPGEWDCKHICDPSVIKGEFNYNGEVYNYLMSYLGCMTDGNYENAFGFALSKQPQGPWVKVPEISPLIDFYEDYGGTNGKMQWGTGQPSIVSVDKKGKVLVFYTKHTYQDNGWGTMVERWDFSDLNNAKRDFVKYVPATGLYQKDGKTIDSITVADFMYDQYRNCIYVGTDVHPFGNGYPDNITDVSRVARLNLSSSEAVLGDTFQSSKIKWEDLYHISQLDTGRGKNTNLGFYRDPYGWLPEKNRIETCVSAAENHLVSDSWQFFFTLKLFRVEHELKQQKRYLKNSYRY